MPDNLPPCNPISNMASQIIESDHGQSPKTMKQWNFFRNYNTEVRHLAIDHDTRERERQITKIVDDGSFKFRIFFVAASGFLASSYSLFAVDLLSIALVYVYPPDPSFGDPGLIFDELTLVGTIMGMLVIGHLADRSGRKKWYGAELSILIVATMGMVQSSAGFMTDTTNEGEDRSMNIYSWICLWRWLLGFGIGAEYPLSSIITAEWASTESRGIMLSAVFSMQSIGRLLSFAVSLGALRVASHNQKGLSGTHEEQQLVVDQVWRWTVGVALIPAGIAILLRFTIPETPRFYASIMKDTRKGVQNAARLYRHNETRESVGIEPASLQEPDIEDTSFLAWYKGWRTFLANGGWRPLAVISCLWAVMDVPWYGLTMDLSSALATLMHAQDGDKSVLHTFRRASNETNSPQWNKDFWNPDNTVYEMIKQNALRSIMIVSIASVAGSLCSILIIDFFRRKHILITTFILIGILFGIIGGTLVGMNSESHLSSIICYAILQFIFNLGPNTLIFVLAAEIFPTAYRGTSNGIAAASGKLGAVLIRGVIAATKYEENRENSLGIRLLVLIPFMFASAWISKYLPDVQMIPKRTSGEELPRQNVPEVPNEAPNLGAWYPPSAPTDIELQGRSSDVSSQDSLELRPAQSKPGFFHRLKNIPLEDIAPGPTQEQSARVTSRPNMGEV